MKWLKDLILKHKTFSIVFTLLGILFGASFFIQILTIQSYPVVGNPWVTDFTVIGKGNLKITPFNGTLFDKDLEFTSLKCGDKIIEPTELTDLYVKFENYYCFSESHFEVKVLSSGKHTLRFEFGNEVDYSYNDAILEEWKENCQVRCIDGKCNTILGKTIWVNDSDGTCKLIEQANSLKNAWDVVYLSKSDHFNITIHDYNFTHIKGNLSASKDLEEEELEFEGYIEECNETDCWKVSKFKWKFKWKPEETETEFEFDTMDLWGVSPSALTYHFDPKEYWGTTNAVHNVNGNVTSTVNSNNGVASNLNGKNAEYIDFLAWNDSMPTGFMINEINFTVDVQNVDNCFGLAVQHNKTGSYVTECSWADVDSQNPLVCEFNIPGEPNPWWTQDVNNLGIRLLSSDCDGGSPDHGEIDYGEMYIYYAQPTTIQLQDADTENLEDMLTDSSYPDYNYGTFTALGTGNYDESDSEKIQKRSFIKFDISVIPNEKTIVSSSLNLFIYGNFYDSGEIANLSVWEFNNQTWFEGTKSGATGVPSYNNYPLGIGGLISYDATIDGDWNNWWQSLNVISWVSNQYDLNKSNVSFVLKSEEVPPSTEDDSLNFWSKEYTTDTTKRPYLNITYSEPDTTPPTYSDNSTNTTYAGADTLFSLNWSDETGLATSGGYIFSFDNGTGSLTNDSWVAFSSNPDWSNVTKTVNSTVGATINWRVHSNDTSDNWNNSETFSYVTTEAPPSDTCNPDSPLTEDYIFDCNDNCSQDATLNANGYNIIWNGAGNYYLEHNIINVKNITRALTCNFYIGKGNITMMKN